MIQTLEEGMKNQSKWIKVPREIRPFDLVKMTQTLTLKSILLKRSLLSI